jgi:hypothetical protein
LIRVATLAILLASVPSAASADWLVMPFLGTAFAGETSFLDLEQGAGQTKVTLGASVALLGDSFLGIEGDVGHSPGFFKGDAPLGPVLANSRVTTVSGNIIVATPVSITRESLRPYLVSGLGLMQARAEGVAQILSVERDLLGLSLGGGAIGMVTPFTGVRFDVRYIKAITGDRGEFAREGNSRLSFWRASVALTLRY